MYLPTVIRAGHLKQIFPGAIQPPPCDGTTYSTENYLPTPHSYTTITVFRLAPRKMILLSNYHPVFTTGMQRPILIFMHLRSTNCGLALLIHITRLRQTS